MFKKLMVTTCLSIVFLGFVLFHCKLPPSPAGPEEANVSLLFKASDGKIDASGSIIDSVGKQVEIGIVLNLTHYIDSAIINVLLDSTIEQTFPWQYKKDIVDTVFFKTSFTSPGTRQVVATAYIKNQPNSVATGKILVFGQTIQNVNHKPVLNVPDSLTVCFGQTVSFPVSATDPDVGQQVSISVIKKPDNSTFSADTFKWTPTTADTGKDTVIFVATDNGSPIMTETESVIINISSKPVNRAPEWNAVKVQSHAFPGTIFTYELSNKCTDPDNDNLTFSLLSAPPVKDTVVGTTYSFTPSVSDTGKQMVRIVARDPSGMEDTLTLELSISTAASDNFPPLISIQSPSKDTVITVDSFEVKVICIDDSGCSVKGFLDETAFDLKKSISVTNLWTGKIKGLKAGSYSTIKIVATDSSAAKNKDSASVRIKWSKVTTFTLSINTTNGSVTKSPDAMVYDSGTVVTLTPIPADKYHFSGWSGALTGSANPAAITMNSTKSVTAVFEANLPNTFTLIIVATNGTVKKTPDLPQYDSGSSVGLKATANIGYRFVNWSGDATETTDTTTTALTKSKNITANFELIPYQLTVAAINGKVTSPAIPTVTVNHGFLMPIKAVANTGYSFSNWTSTSGTATITSATTDSTTVSLTNGNATVTANFTANPITLTLTNDGHGSTTPVSSTSGSFGVPINISATPSSGYSFSSWTLTTGTATFGNENQTSTTVTLTANATIKANFFANPVTLTLTNDGHGSTTPASSASGSYGVPINISAIPSNGYSFSSWTITNGTATIGNENQASTTVTLSANVTIKANFSANPVTLTLTNDGHGSTTPASSASGSYGVPINISATPSSGYSFFSWSITPSTAGNIANTTQASTSVTLTSSTATVKANFVPVDYTITYFDKGSGSHPSTYNISQTPVALGTAIKTGFTFVGWFDNQGLTGNKVTTIPSGSTGPKSFWAKWVVMDRDGNVYDTVIINGITWMKTNLKTVTLSNGTNIMKDYLSNWGSEQNPQSCYYNFDPNNGKVHGILYNASAAKSSILAPEGWHVATKEEWIGLVPNPNIGSELASIYYWNGIGTNTTGFSATPGGSIGCDGSSIDQGNIGYWWTSTMGSKLDFAQFGLVHGMLGYDVTESTSECNGYSIRCVLNH